LHPMLEKRKFPLVLLGVINNLKVSEFPFWGTRINTDYQDIQS